jgi:alkyl hydroperoxide reductase subunit AhpC
LQQNLPQAKIGSSFDHLVRAGKRRRRNFTAEHKVATPVNWKNSEDVIIVGRGRPE